MKDIHKRVGKFYIGDELLMGNPEIVQKIMSKVIVIRAEHLFISRRFEYAAISESFDVLEEGVEAPIYEILIKNEDFSFEKTL